MTVTLMILQVIAIDLLLGGDNAIVIALACRNLKTAQRAKAILYGTFGAIASRIVLAFFAVQLLTIPYLGIVGGIALLWIAYKLAFQKEDESPQVTQRATLFGAIQAIAIADLVMSLDNVIAITGASGGHIAVIAAGVAISIPMIVYGSKLLIILMEKWPAIVYLGAAMIGWIGVGMILDGTS